MDKCILNCNKSANDAVRTVQQKCLETIITSSCERNDGIHEHLNGVLSLQVHEACYKSYVRQ